MIEKLTLKKLLRMPTLEELKQWAKNQSDVSKTLYNKTEELRERECNIEWNEMALFNWESKIRKREIQQRERELALIRRIATLKEKYGENYNLKKRKEKARD